jgi:hypothetical protein
MMNSNQRFEMLDLNGASLPTDRYHNKNTSSADLSAIYCFSLLKAKVRIR